jgi:glucokinase
MTSVLDRATGAPVIALDVGATHIKGAVVADSGKRLASVRLPTGRGDGPSAVLDRVADVAVSLAGSVDVVGSAGIAVCGAVDPSGLVTAVNLGWSGTAVGSFVASRLGVPVSVINDAHAGALGEGEFGAARGVGDYLYVSIGTGIGAAIITDGRLQRGAHGHAGELGHIKVDHPGRPCACGSRGCVETVMSAAALEARWTGVPLSAHEILDLVIADDPSVSELWSSAVDAFAAGLVTAVSLIDPATIVLGGGISRAGAQLIEPLSARIAAAAPSFHTKTELRLATLGDWSGCLGAAAGARAALLLPPARAGTPRAGTPRAPPAPAPRPARAPPAPRPRPARAPRHTSAPDALRPKYHDKAGHACIFATRSPWSASPIPWGKCNHMVRCTRRSVAIQQT